LRKAQEEVYEHYTALWYVWGHSNDTTLISVDGHQLEVSQCLECALRHVRHDRRSLNVWADGVCINQKDDSEKGLQVQQMGQVYENATHTIIFLGQNTSIEASVSKLIKLYDMTQNPIFMNHRPLSEEKMAVDELLSCPWFNRVWIFQELVLSKDPKIQYGQLRFSWKTLCTLADYVEDSMSFDI